MVWVGIVHVGMICMLCCCMRFVVLPVHVPSLSLPVAEETADAQPVQEDRERSSSQLSSLPGSQTPPSSAASSK
jgi:hypothetical protein